MVKSVRWHIELREIGRISVLVRPHAINLLVDDDSPSFTFDPAGRLHGAFIAGKNYRRSLDNRMLCKWAEPAAGRRQRQRRWLADSEARSVIDLAYGLARQAGDASSGAPRGVQQALAQVARWDAAALERDRQRFQQIYTPIGILPPDQYLALVLQATHGCSHNVCTFCTFYRDIPFRIKSPDEFRQHVASVLDFFGSALAMRRSIFLADANALVIPMPRLLALLEVLGEGGSQGAKETRKLQTIGELAVPGSSFISQRSAFPLFAFIDAFHVERKTVSDWSELSQKGLTRVYIGMETGHDPLLRWLNKPGDALDVLEAVRTLKAAGVNVSVIIMLGVGGDRYAAGHVEDTIALLNAMPLASGDLIYFSDLVDHLDASYAGLAAEAGILPLDFAGRRQQEAAIRAGFQAQDREHPPQLSRYDIEEFVY
jgi:hypothetical protein